MTYPSNEAGAENVAGAELRQFVERIARLDEEQRAIGDDKEDVYGEARSRGHDVKTIRKVVQLRRKDPRTRMEEAAILETYLAALGMSDEREGPAHDQKDEQKRRDRTCARSSRTPARTRRCGRAVYRRPIDGWRACGRR